MWLLRPGYAQAGSGANAAYGARLIDSDRPGLPSSIPANVMGITFDVTSRRSVQ